MKSQLVIAVSIVAAIIAACAGPGAGKSTFESGDVKSGGTSGQTIEDDDDDTSTSSSSSSSGDPVFGTSTFAYKAPSLNADAQTAVHAAAPLPVDGKNCVQATCHLDSTKKWGFAGTVYSGSNKSTTVATEVEVGVVYSDNKIRSAMTDAQGNFWLEANEYPTAGAKIGVRKNGGAPQYMTSALPSTASDRGACNSELCHGSDTNRIFVQ